MNPRLGRFLGIMAMGNLAVLAFGILLYVVPVGTDLSQVGRVIYDGPQGHIMASFGRRLPEGRGEALAETCP